MNGIIRFAPSTTGHAHPGTLLSALLCWLDARSRGDRFMIRLENLDPERCTPAYEQSMLDDLAWFGLDWDVVVRQSGERHHHELMLDHLAERGLIYPCSCSRARIKALNKPAADGGFVYDNACRGATFPSGGWRSYAGTIRLKLPEHVVELHDESGIIYRQTPHLEMGDPVVRRRDGAIAYHLACVVDDARTGIKRLIRGRDLLPSAPVQILLQQLLGFDRPAYRHHALFLETHGVKLAKFHGAVGAPELRKYYRGDELCGMIAHWAGIIPAAEPCRPADLIKLFRWANIHKNDFTLAWDGQTLHPVPGDPAPAGSPGTQA
jgi:glutamyl/glutaminyl-tRNA synthetase